jgi:hypothetical protein
MKIAMGSGATFDGRRRISTSISSTSCARKLYSIVPFFITGTVGAARATRGGRQKRVISAAFLAETGELAWAIALADGESRSGRA